MAAPWLGDVVPFSLRHTAGLVPEPPPPHLQSGAYATAYDEAKATGARVGSTRTPEQTELALFYSANIPAQMYGVVRNIAAAQVIDIGDSARLFALVSIAGADALIASWDAKKQYNFWRPSTAMVEGDYDGNPRTAGDPAWLPLVNDPPYPEYASGANALTGAYVRTLALLFGDGAFSFDVPSSVPMDARTRSYTQFSHLADDMVEARILCGIHFRFSDLVGRRQGQQAAEWVFAHELRPIGGAGDED